MSEESDYEWGIKGFKDRSRSAWEQYVLDQTFKQAGPRLAVSAMLGAATGGGFAQQLEFHGNVSREEFSILDKIYKAELDSKNALPTIHNVSPHQRNNFYKSLTNQIVRAKKERIIGRLNEVVDSNSENVPFPTFHLLTTGVQTLYLLLCNPDRFLVGTKSVTAYKKVGLPISKRDVGPDVLYLASNYMNFLPYIGARELDVVPTRIIHPDLVDRVSLPRPVRSVGELLEDAYFNYHYNVPDRGAEVRFRQARDVRTMLMIQTGNRLYAKVGTSFGESLVSINLNDAGFMGIGLPKDFELGTEYTRKPPWATITAEVYHDLVTAKEIPITQYRNLRPLSDKMHQDLGPIDDQPQVIYIPRTVKVGVVEDTRKPYQGSPRPVRPHHVIGYRRSGNMTDDHRRVLRQFEQKFQVNIIDKIPEGYTWVRPYFVPADAEEAFQRYPLFIKRKFQTEIERGLEL